MKMRLLWEGLGRPNIRGMQKSALKQLKKGGGASWKEGESTKMGKRQEGNRVNVTKIFLKMHTNVTMKFIMIYN